MFTVKTKKDFKLKSGVSIKKDMEVQVHSFLNDGRITCVYVPSISKKFHIPTYHANKYLKGFTGIPSTKALERMVTDSRGKTVTGQYTAPDGFGNDGSPSWLLVLGLI